MKTFNTDSGYEAFLQEIKRISSSYSFQSESIIKKYLKDELELSTNQTEAVFPCLIDSVKNTSDTMKMKTMLEGLYEKQSTKGTMGYGECKASLDQYTFRKDFTFEYRNEYISSYMMSTPFYVTNYASNPSTIIERGIYFIGKSDPVSLALEVIVCLLNGNSREILIDLRNETINGHSVKKSYYSAV